MKDRDGKLLMAGLDVQVYGEISERNRATETRTNGKQTNAQKDRLKRALISLSYWNMRKGD